MNFVRWKLIVMHLQVYPCPKGSVRHREMVRRFGGNEQYVISLIIYIEVLWFHMLFDIVALKVESEGEDI